MRSLCVFPLLFAPLLFGQPESRQVTIRRDVHGQTIVSKDLPEATLIINRKFRYLGTQRVTLYGNAEAEQYMFAKTGAKRTLQAFYWIQFEHFLPTNDRTYDYSPSRTIGFGALNFVYDVKSWPDYARLQAEDARSDGAAMIRLIGKQKLFFPRRAVRVRMFHLPTPDHRAELMIIYGEAVEAEPDIPMHDGGVELDSAAPALAQKFLVHARAGLIIQR